jgi:hypothetical protein
MTDKPISGSKEVIQAFRKEDPRFCEFLIETGRLEAA